LVIFIEVMERGSEGRGVGVENTLPDLKAIHHEVIKLFTYFHDV